MPNIQEAEFRHASHYLQTIHAANELYRRGGENIPLALLAFDHDWGQIQQGFVRISTYLEKSETAATLCNDYVDTSVFLINKRFTPEERICWLELGLIAARKLKERTFEAVYLHNMGGDYVEIGEYQQALDCYRQSLELYEELDDLNHRIRVHIDLGNLFIRISNFQTALEVFKSVLHTARQIGARKTEVLALRGLGHVHGRLKQFAEALHFHEAALAMHKSIFTGIDEYIYLADLGVAYANLGNDEKALECLHTALTTSRDIRDLSCICVCLTNLASYHWRLGEHEKGIAYFEEALNMARNMGSRAEEAFILNKLGNIYVELESYEKALTYLEQAYSCEDWDERRRSDILGQLGNIYLVLGQPNKARFYFEQAIELCEKRDYQDNKGDWIYGFGHSLILLGDTQEGLDYLQRAHAFYENRDAIDMLNTVNELIADTRKEQKRWAKPDWHWPWKRK